jgi:hypothetical protein
MATVNLGRIKPVFRGAYNNSTAYVVDDIVTSGNETFIAIAATQGNATSDASKWTKLAAKGADGDSFSLANKEIAFKTNAGALDGIPIGTAGQALKVNSGATGYEFGTITTGAFTLAEFKNMNMQTETHAGNATTAYRLSSGSGSLTITPTATTDLLYFLFSHNVEGSSSTYLGQAVGMNTANSGWTTSTGSSQLVLSMGEYAQGMGQGHDSDRYQRLTLVRYITAADLGMSAGTTYHFVPYQLVHSQAGQFKSAQNTTQENNMRGFLTIIRYTANP